MSDSVVEAPMNTVTVSNMTRQVLAVVSLSHG
jgi:hypothetical protein